MSSRYANHAFTCLCDAKDNEFGYLELVFGITEYDIRDWSKGPVNSISIYYGDRRRHSGYNSQDTCDMSEALTDYEGALLSLDDAWRQYPSMRPVMGSILTEYGNMELYPKNDIRNGYGKMNVELAVLCEFAKDMCMIYKSVSMQPLAKQLGVEYKG